MPEWIIRLIETPEEMDAVQELQRLVWPGPETEVIPAHALLAVVHNGGLLLGAFVNEKLVGAAWGFPGFYSTPDGPRLKHCSHILAVHPEWRDSGLGFGISWLRTFPCVPPFRTLRAGRVPPKMFPP
jgi:predicted GNAT superfamily acetyltransferase